MLKMIVAAMILGSAPERNLRTISKIQMRPKVSKLLTAKG